MFLYGNFNSLPSLFPTYKYMNVFMCAYVWCIYMCGIYIYVWCIYIYIYVVYIYVWCIYIFICVVCACMLAESFYSKYLSVPSPKMDIL